MLYLYVNLVIILLYYYLVINVYSISLYIK
nr:MAG TPA: hypothetical protein [Caudoviricetes sp.]